MNSKTECRLAFAGVFLFLHFMKSNADSFPKILFVNDYSPDSEVLADLIRQLLLGYPVEKIAWWHCRHTRVYAKPDLQAGSVDCFTLPAKLVPNKRWTAAKSLLLENFWLPLAARHLRRTITRVKPDVVWIFGNSNCWAGFAATAANLPNVRLHVSLWDYPDSNASKHALGTTRARRFLSRIFQFIKKADTYDTLCRSSLEEIHLQTGRKDGLIVHSGFEPGHLEVLKNSSAGHMNDDGVLRLAYVGTVVYENGFLEMLAALEKVRAAQPRKVVLEFFGGRNYRSRSWFNPDWMIEHGLFTDQGLIDAVRRCSWGIVVADPKCEDPRGSRFSFPNKIGTYLSAGVPVLGYSHPQSSFAQIMQEHHLGRFTSTTQRGELEEFLAESLRLPSPQDFFRDDILRCARTEFNAAEMRERLWKTWGAALSL
jgi:hypothetical protein